MGDLGGPCSLGGPAWVHALLSLPLRPFSSRCPSVALSSPQGFVLTVTIIREAVEEIRCYVRDKEVNSHVYSRLTARGQPHPLLHPGQPGPGDPWAFPPEADLGTSLAVTSLSVCVGCGGSVGRGVSGHRGCQHPHGGCTVPPRVPDTCSFGSFGVWGCLELSRGWTQA